jgi:hypothetical protein
MLYQLAAVVVDGPVSVKHTINWPQYIATTATIVGMLALMMNYASRKAKAGITNIADGQLVPVLQSVKEANDKLAECITKLDGRVSYLEGVKDGQSDTHKGDRFERSRSSRSGA